MGERMPTLRVERKWAEKHGLMARGDSLYEEDYVEVHIAEIGEAVLGSELRPTFQSYVYGDKTDREWMIGKLRTAAKHAVITL